MRERRLRAEHARRFKKAVDDLNKLRNEVAEYLPDVNWYLAMSSLHLMSGPSHAGLGERAQQQNVLDSNTLDYSGGGDW